MDTNGNSLWQTDPTQGILHQTVDSPKPEVHWFIFRYMTLTSYARDHFRKSSLEVFFPHYRVSGSPENTGKADFQEKPVIPGYIFVHAGLDDAINLGKDIDMSLWRRRQPLSVDASKILTGSHDLKEYKTLKLAERTAAYYSIDDESMRQLIRTVELYSNGFHLFDAGDIDYAKDDFVEITQGPFQGVRGHLKSVNGTSGGVVVVPLQDESTSFSSSLNTLLHYGIPVNASEISILSFAKGSRRATDQINHSSKVVDRLVVAYSKGEDITVQQRNRLTGYAQRFGETQPDSLIQRTNLALLLYRIYTILELSTESQFQRDLLEKELLPQCRERMEKARIRDRVSARNTFDKCILKKVEADNAHDKRLNALARKAGARKTKKVGYRRKKCKTSPGSQD